MRTRRLGADERRSQLLRTAARLVDRRGLSALTLTGLADAARVSRPIVYRFFPDKRALVVAMLEDFEAALRARFFESAVLSAPGTIEAATRVFIEAICDTIEEKGTAGWDLLDARGPDPQVAKVAAAIYDRLLAPWLPRIAERTGAARRDVAVLVPMIVAAGRAALELWYTRKISREAAVRAATRGVSGLLAAFEVAR